MLSAAVSRADNARTRPLLSRIHLWRHLRHLRTRGISVAELDMVEVRLGCYFDREEDLPEENMLAAALYPSNDFLRVGLVS
jgi:hypothetical protein